MLSLAELRVFLDDVWVRFKAHSEGNPDAHHTKYTDMEAVVAMGAKTDMNPLHHDKTIADAVYIYPHLPHSPTSGAPWLVDWGTDSHIMYEYGDMFTSTQSDRITIKKAGLYLVMIKGHYASSAAGLWRAIYLYRNGAYHSYASNNSMPIATMAMILTHSVTLKLAVNDYLETYLYQDTGGVLSWSANAPGYGIWVTMLREA